jgi:hypothetical protein
MGIDRVRVVGLALVSLALIVASVLVMEWFVVRVTNDASGIEKIAFDLRAIRVCQQNMCVVVELSQVPLLSRLGVYSSLAPATFWTSLGFAALVAFQGGARAIVGAASLTYTRLGYFLGTIFAGIAVGTAYMFAPEVGPFTVTRTAAPLLLFVGYAVGMAAMYYSSRHEDVFSDKPVRTLPIATAMPVETPEPAPAVSRTRSRPIPLGLRGKLNYTAVTAEISRAGLDARREDNTTRLVLWRDVVGAVARRLPPTEPYASTAFVDIVSTAESTLRLLPWTKFSGEPLDGDVDGDGEARARAVLALVIARCPEAKLDRATRAFYDGREPPAQLPDEPTLAQHDERLA